MKKKQLFTLLLVAIFFITMCGFFGPKKWIRAGDKAMAAKKYKDAISHYQKAGPDAKDKLIEACMASYGACFTEDSGEDERYIKRHEWLKRDLATVMSEQEISQLMIQKLTEKLDMRNEMVEDPNRVVSSLDASVINTDCDEMFLFLEEIPDATPGSSELENYIYDTKANILYKSLEDTASDSYYSKAFEENPGWIRLAETKKYAAYSSTITEILENWSNSNSKKAGEINNCIEEFKAGNYEAAAEKLMKLLPNEEVNVLILNAVAIENLSKDFNALLEYNHFMCRLNGYEESSRLENILNGIDAITFDIMEDDLSTELTEDHKQQLKERTGKNPKGKILFIHNRNDWEHHVDLYNKLMNNLPDQYYPETLESVEFIIELKYDSERVGKYTDGSSSLCPAGIVTVYKAPNWNKIFTVTEKGQAKAIVYGNESKSVYPEMSEVIEKAIEKILTQLK